MNLCRLKNSAVVESRGIVTSPRLMGTEERQTLQRDRQRPIVLERPRA